jgi:DNA polymerase III delta subunit
MLIFLYGNDSYRRTLRTNWWIKEYRKKHGFSPALQLDMSEEGTLDMLREFVVSKGMFDSYKLIVLHNVFESEDAAKLAKFLEMQKARSDIIFIVSEEKFPPPSFKFLLDTKWCEKFNLLQGKELKSFLKQEAERRGIVLGSQEVINLLINASGGDTWWLATELDRAALLERKKLDAADFADLDLEAKNTERLLRELLSPSRSTRLTALEKLLRKRYDPALIFNKISYYAPQKVHLFADYDVRVKSGKLDYDEALLAIAVF